MRVYLPLTLPALADVLREGAVSRAPVHGFAVTPALREAYASGDEEELEYVAMLAAARESLRMLRADPQAPRRRVVLAADAEATWIAYDDEPAAVVISDPVPFAALASGHIDDPGAEPDVAVAVTSIAAADAGDVDAEFAVDSAEGHELAWYATQELKDFMEEITLPGRPLAVPGIAGVTGPDRRALTGYGCRHSCSRPGQRAGAAVSAGQR
jgi:hypothetical protein